MLPGGATPATRGGGRACGAIRGRSSRSSAAGAGGRSGAAEAEEPLPSRLGVPVLVVSWWCDVRSRAAGPGAWRPWCSGSVAAGARRARGARAIGAAGWRFPGRAGGPLGGRLVLERWVPRAAPLPARRGCACLQEVAGELVERERAAAGPGAAERSGPGGGVVACSRRAGQWRAERARRPAGTGIGQPGRRGVALAIWVWQQTLAEEPWKRTMAGGGVRAELVDAAGWRGLVGASRRRGGGASRGRRAVPELVRSRGGAAGRRAGSWNRGRPAGRKIQSGRRRPAGGVSGAGRTGRRPGKRTGEEAVVLERGHGRAVGADLVRSRRRRAE